MFSNVVRSRRTVRSRSGLIPTSRAKAGRFAHSPSPPKSHHGSSTHINGQLEEEASSQIEKLIILSDLWGARKSDWINYYVAILENHFKVIFYDCCDLADIDLSDFSEDKIHEHFTNGGIERAVKKLLENEGGNVTVLGFSVGGLIAWKAALEGLKVGNLFALSSTRLRYEEKQPKSAISLFYGGNDKYKPSEEWFRRLNLKMNIYEGQEHDFYSNQEIAIEVSKKIIEQVKPNR